MSQILLGDVRKKFLEYFKKNNHEIVESSNLVPNNDPTLMFTNSGMVSSKTFLLVLKKDNITKPPHHKSVLGQVENITI
jgi:alanyl-tRNA synthetase